MFTGIVRSLVPIGSATSLASGARRFSVSLPRSIAASPSDSIAIDGVCLTVETVKKGVHTFTAVAETLSKTNLGAYTKGRKVHVEPALKVGGRLGGHFVTGHVDGLARATSVKSSGGGVVATFTAPPALMRHIAARGSVALNGVSLTVARTTSRTFTVAFVPETLRRTHFENLKKGATVHLETDLLAKYILSA